MALIPDDVYAFPFFVASTGEACPGMTLRDWFAGQALAGVLKICKDDSTEPGQERQQMFAARAYELADAMLEARK